MKGLAQPNQSAQSAEVDPRFQGEGDENIGAGLTEAPATAQEQAMYDALVEPMLGMIHGEQTKDQIVQSLKDGMSIADLTYQIGMAVVGQIEKQGKTVPEEILQMAAEDVVEDLVEISVTIGVIPDQQEAIEKAYVGGLMGAIDKYGQKMRDAGLITMEGGAAHIDEMTALGGFEKTQTAQAVGKAVQDKQEV